MVRDVRPFEEMKLGCSTARIRRSPISACCSATQTVAEAFADPAIRRFVDGLWAEAIPTLPEDAGLDPQAYIGRTGRRVSTIRRLRTAPRRSPMTAARSCRSASSPRRWSGPAQAPIGRPSDAGASPPGSPRARRADAACRRAISPIRSTGRSRRSPPQTVGARDRERRSSTLPASPRAMRASRTARKVDVRPSRNHPWKGHCARRFPALAKRSPCHETDLALVRPRRSR